MPVRSQQTMVIEHLEKAFLTIATYVVGPENKWRHSYGDNIINTICDNQESGDCISAPLTTTADM